MNGSDFDNLVRERVVRASRRHLLRLGAVPLLGVASLTAVGGDVSAGRKCKKKKRKACVGRCGIVTYTCKNSHKKKKKQVDCGACPTPCDVCASGCTFNTVQAAIDAASPGASVAICAGTFAENLRIDKNLTLAGAGRSATILDGKAANSVIAINPGLTAVTIRDLTITNGKSPGVGGGISNGTSQTTLINVLVTGNVAETRGGGLDVNVGGRVALSNSVISSNTAGDFGGGVFSFGVIACTDSTITGNTKGTPPTASNCEAFAPGSGCDTCPA
ncbi:MAG: hypothetical protein KC442_13230 [Thermomicrobiales bacterium]|nr:hypothetical protein [Thermomicrobiales bacterium]